MDKTLLEGKKILLGVTGSIAIYKALELIRLYIKAGAEVKVIMSEEAKRFITPLTFEAISQHKVLHVDTESWSETLNNHISAGKWADIFVIAPLSVNTLNKLSHGIADNLLSQTAIACSKPMVIAPSANTNMMLHPITVKSLDTLQRLGYHIVAPQRKLLACNDEGIGALADIEAIFFENAKILLQEEFWIGRDVLISGGGTIEKIDDVRYISNFSSGKQASALALAYYLKGARVTLITSGEIPSHIAIHSLHVNSSLELKSALLVKMEAMQALEKTPILIMCAAVSDYVPLQTHKGKLKKESLGECYSIELKKNIDILSQLPKKGFKVIGFKAELDETVAHENAKAMLLTKELDAVCLNIITPSNAFGSLQNEIYFYDTKGVQKIPLCSKFLVAQTIVELSATL